MHLKYHSCLCLSGCGEGIFAIRAEARSAASSPHVCFGPVAAPATSRVPVTCHDRARKLDAGPAGARRSRLGRAASSGMQSVGDTSNLVGVRPVVSECVFSACMWPFTRGETEVSRNKRIVWYSHTCDGYSSDRRRRRPRVGPGSSCEESSSP